jgi:hypothetical protein
VRSEIGNGSPERVESRPLGELDRAGLLTLRPLCPRHHHVGRTAAPGADEPHAPLGDGGIGLYRSAISAASGSTRWPQALHHTISRTRAAAAFWSVIGGPGADSMAAVRLSSGFVFP